MCKMFFEAMVLAVALSAVAKADDEADPKAILSGAIKAQGGEEVLSKVVGTYSDAKGTAYEGGKSVPIHYEWFTQGNDKMRTVSLDANNKIDEIEVINGKKGWVKDGDQATEELSKEQLESRREIIYANWALTLVPLKAEGFRLSPLEETSVGGRKAIGILVSHDNHDPLKLYFDKESHFLVKYQRKFKNVDAGKDFVEDSVFSDYRTVQGTQQPFTAVTSWDGQKISNLAITEMKLYEKPPDETLFSKP